MKPDKLWSSPEGVSKAPAPPTKHMEESYC